MAESKESSRAGPYSIDLETKRRSEQRKEFKEFANRQIGRVADNLRRTQSLIALASDLFSEAEKTKSTELTLGVSMENCRHERQATAARDVLRSAVVFLHATLEDYLRYLACVCLPDADEETLDRIPLANISPHNKPEKFQLGKLAKHRGKKVEDLIRESVVSYFEKSSFSSTDEIASLLRQIKIPQDQLRRHYPSLQEMMERRHQIVHRADLIEDLSAQKRVVRELDPKNVQEWKSTVEKFIGATVTEASIVKHWPNLQSSRVG